MDMGYHNMRVILTVFITSLLSILVIYTSWAHSKETTIGIGELSPKIDKKIEQSLEKLKVVQGVSVAIYTANGMHVKGYGITDKDTQEIVTLETPFYIASSTKSMFALAMAILHERGDIDLDQSLSQFSPTAPFSKKINTDKITLRHLLAMSSGIKNSAYVHRVAFSGEYDQEILWQLIGATQVNRSRNIRFGKFRYTNWNYNLLARLVEQKLGKSWQEILSQEVFQKIDFAHTTAYISEAKQQGWSQARAHITLGPDAPKRSYLEKDDARMHSAGGVIMSANDAAKWLEVFIQNGQLNGRQIFPVEAVQATRKRWTQVDSEFSGYVREHYGLGWYIGPYGDDLLVHHFGGFSGARAHISYMPERKIGVAIFVNDSAVGGLYIDHIANFIYDSFTGMLNAEERFDKAIDDVDIWANDLSAKIAMLRDEINARQWSLSQPLNHYVGLYKNKSFGTIKISIEESRLRITNGNLTAIAQAGSKAETLRAELIPLEGEAVEFKISRDGRVESLKYKEVRFIKE